MTKSTELTMMKVTTTMALNDRQTERLTDSRQTRLARQLAGALFKWNMSDGRGGATGGAATQVAAGGATCDCRDSSIGQHRVGQA